MECGDSFIQTEEDDIYLAPGATFADHEFIASAKNAVPEYFDTDSSTTCESN